MTFHLVLGAGFFTHFLEDVGIFMVHQQLAIHIKNSNLNKFGKVFSIVAGKSLNQLNWVLTPASLISILEIPILGGPEDPERISSYYCI